MRKVAIIVGGWHYPYHFYDKLNQMQIPNDTIVDKFIISHRSPDLDIITKEKSKLNLGPDNILKKMDSILYDKIIKQTEIEKMNYRYNLVDNVAGDYYFVHQWMGLYDYKQYDYIFFFHDDNYLINDKLLVDVLDKKAILYDMEGNTVNSESYWLVLFNSTVGVDPSPRGSFSVFNKYLFDIMPKFDFVNVSLNRVNKFDTPAGHEAIADWNAILRNMKGVIERANIKNMVFKLSKVYRCSPYIFECERGFCQKAWLPINVKYVKEMMQ